MKFFKENPIFCIVLIVLLLAIAGGGYLSYSVFEKSRHHATSEGSAEAGLKRALALKPSPTQANLDAAKANLESLKEALRHQVETTKGTDPALISEDAPTQGNQLLFQLDAYREELTREAARTIPINVNEKSVAEGNIRNPGVKLPERFTFGFSRYLNSGKPPSNAEVPYLFLQKEILNYILSELLETRPIEIRSVQRESVAAAAAAPRVTARRGAQAGQDNAPAIADEFAKVKETAYVKDVVDTIGFRVVFTGYTENLRLFMKTLEEFQLPLVVRSVAVKPLEASVRTPGQSQRRGGATSLDSIFGIASGTEAPSAAQAKSAQEPVVAENISEFTVVIEYITVTLKIDSAN